MQMKCWKNRRTAGLSLYFFHSKLREKHFKDSVSNSTTRFEIISSFKIERRWGRNGRQSLPTTEEFAERGLRLI